MRIRIEKDPYGIDRKKHWAERGIWPSKWITCPEAGDTPFVTAYRLKFAIESETTVRAHVSADERYELFLDGKRVGRGSERGDRNNWFYESYDLHFSKGKHILVARVWTLGSQAPFAQMTVYPGFIFSPEGEFIKLLGTGVAPWEAKKLDGYEFTSPLVAWGTGSNLNVDGERFFWGFERGEGEGWVPAISIDQGANGLVRNEYPPVHLMKPATLPPMYEKECRVGVVRFVADVPSTETREIAVKETDNLYDKVQEWNKLLSKGSITVPPATTRRVIIDLENYYCLYPEIVTSSGKGSHVRIYWAESLFEKASGNSKGNRNEVEGKYFRGVGDIFKPDGRAHRRFDTLWWQAGRYIEVFVETAEEPLKIERFSLWETRYPLEMESTFESDMKQLEPVISICLRGLQMCSHETYMDCPYYEQLMYVGDTRLEALTTYTVTRDVLLPRKAISMFNASRLTDGLTQSRYPSRVTQIITPFSLWWVGMVYDYALWRNDPAFVRSMMPGVRGVLDCYATYLNSDGMIQGPRGWNYMDWVPEWTPGGIPPDGEFGVNGSINWQYILILTLAAELEEYMVEPEMASRNRRCAAALAKCAAEAFWDANRGLLAENLSKTHFSEHTQCLALLSGQLDPAIREEISRNLFTDKELSRTTIYFTHYFFEVCRLLKRIDVLFERLNLWIELEGKGFKTTREAPEPSRSDCHGWGAHPIYHLFASVMGIRPASMGFRSVSIEPQPGPLTCITGKLVHPQGEIEVDLSVQDRQLRGKVVLPENITGSFVYKETEILLAGGVQTIQID